MSLSRVGGLCDPVISVRMVKNGYLLILTNTNGQQEQYIAGNLDEAAGFVKSLLSAKPEQP